MVEEKARVVLSKSEFATLAYYQEEYAASQMTIEAFVAVLLELLSTPEKVNIGTPAPPRPALLLIPREPRESVRGLTSYLANGVYTLPCAWGIADRPDEGRERIPVAPNFLDVDSGTARFGES